MNQQNLISSLAPLYLFLCGLAGSVDSQVLDSVSEQSGPQPGGPGALHLLPGSAATLRREAGPQFPNAVGWT